MKTVFALAALAACAAAQNVFIQAPARNTSLLQGQHFIVDIVRPDTLTPSQEVAVAIGLVPCPRGRCPPGDSVGAVLYAGPYAPVPQNGSAALFQNFTVTVPEGFPVGNASLVVEHFTLVGAAKTAVLQNVNTTVFVRAQ